MSKKNKLGDFYSPLEICIKLGVSQKWLYRKIASGEMPHYRIGTRLIRIKKSEFHEWLEAKEVPND